MQIPRLFLSVCVAALVLTALTARADDSAAATPAQAAKPANTRAAKAEMKKQAEANAKALKEAQKQAKAEAAANKKTGATARKEAEAKTEKAKPAQAAAQVQPDKKATAFKRLETPPVLISSDKTQRLEQLLRKYKADELTPTEYQKERAKVLAEP